MAGKETDDLSEVESLRLLVQQQQATITALEEQNQRLSARISQLEAELGAQKKLKGKPKLKASRLNQSDVSDKGFGKRAGSAKRNKKDTFAAD